MLSFSPKGRSNAVATVAICSLSQPHPLADAALLGCELAKVSSTGRGLGWGDRRQQMLAS